MRLLSATVLAASACAFTPIAQASCGSAFCSVNTDWASDALGLSDGSVLDIRYEYIPQDQPRTGSSRTSVGAIPRHHDEVRTINNNLLLNYSRGFASGWGFSVQAPLVDREHLHIHNHDGGQIAEEWKFRELGDMRITGRYQAPLGEQERGPRNAGVVFGLKLPTGRTDIANDAGDAAERSLQPGSGTTDAVLGAFFHQQFAASGAAWFAQAQVQHALAERRGFAPGTHWTLDLGYSMGVAAKLSALLQLNAVVKQRDRGAEAEPDDSGSRALFLSPGLAYDVTDGTRLYAFLQQPLYQHVNGVQLTAKRAFTVGLATRF
ncbi:transporter [Ramlibacter sp. PS3R-8]|uniref:transporter n=1 Tax=Ramlibacter sp. PS3R-8 TaxID=3133437 RepID=UPI00309A2AC0